MSKFANLRDAGIRLGTLLLDTDSQALNAESFKADSFEPESFEAESFNAECVLMPIMPNGVRVALGVEAVLGDRTMIGVPLERSDSGADITDIFREQFDDNQVQNKVVVVIDDGVETGTAATAVGKWLKQMDVRELVLAVPVCPKTGINRLQFTFDRIIALNSPLGARSLAWHYEDFDVIDSDQAEKILADRVAR